jgi:ATP synthase subunit 6
MFFTFYILFQKNEAMLQFQNILLESNGVIFNYLSFVYSGLFSIIFGVFLLLFNKEYSLLKNFSLQLTNLNIAMTNLYNVIYSIIAANLTKSTIKYFSYLFSVTLIILFSNIIGLFPYSYAVTSQLVITMFFSLILFLSVNLGEIIKKKMVFLRHFLPNGTPLAIINLLTNIEFVSYNARPLSLGIRLFANITAGHILLKILCLFLLKMLLLKGLSFILAILQALIIKIIYILESVI